MEKYIKHEKNVTSVFNNYFTIYKNESLPIN